jgi:HicA toxin of bacterial toxin-antitoxin,
MRAVCARRHAAPLRVLHIAQSPAFGMLTGHAGIHPEVVLVSHKHEALLRTVFHDPISGNIHWREIESLLGHLGADVEPLSGARIRVKLNGVEGILHRPHHGNTLDKSSVRHLREYLAHARCTPSQYEERK